jgi:hypothetical protein
MKSLGYALLAFVALASDVEAGDPGFTIKVSNPASFVRQQETVVANLNRASGRRGNAMAVFDADSQLVSQALDTDGDGSAEQLVFQTRLGPK